MKVLHIFDEINHSGAEIMYLSAAQMFQSSGVEMVALATGNSPGTLCNEFIDNDIKVIHLPSYRYFKHYKNFFTYYKEYMDILRSENIDVVHIHRALYFFWYAFFARMAGKKKIIRTIHNVFKPIHRYPQHFISRHLGKIINVKYTSIGHSVEFHERKFFFNKTIQINNWIDSSKFFPIRGKDEKMNIRKNLGIDSKAFVIISVGACLPQKQHNHILETISAIADKNLFYIHLGTGPNEAREIEIAKELGIINNTKFVGNVTNVRDYLISADVFVMPSSFEGLGNAALEAMACDILPILYNVTGLRDLLPTNETNLIINPNNADLTKTIIKHMLFSNDKRKELKETLHNALLSYRMEASVNRFIKLYKE